MTVQDKLFTLGTALAFALILAACPAGPAPEKYKGLGEKLNLSGKVYERNRTLVSIDYTGYNGDLAISDGGIGGTGKIENGWLSYSITEQPALSPAANGLEMLEEIYTNIGFSPNDAQAAVLNLQITDHPDYSLLSREIIEIEYASPVRLNGEFVYYVYVDRDVTVTADSGDFSFDGFGFPIDITAKSINFTLKKGWNPLRGKIEGELQLIGFPPAVGGATAALSMSAGNPSSLKWTASSTQFLQF